MSGRFKILKSLKMVQIIHMQLQLHMLEMGLPEKLQITY